MVLPSQRVGHAPLLSLSFDSQIAMAEESEQAAIREVQLQLDVTRVPREDEPFVQLCQVARALATAMEGQVTDDNGRLLAPETIEAIGRDLEGIYDELAARHDFGLPRAMLRVAVNDEFADWSHRLAAGDRVVFIPPVAGG